MARIILHLETQLCCQEQHKKEMSHVADLSQPSRYILLSLHILPYFFALLSDELIALTTNKKAQHF